MALRRRAPSPAALAWATRPRIAQAATPPESRENIGSVAGSFPREMSVRDSLRVSYNASLHVEVEP